MYLYEPYELPEYTPERYRESYLALADIAKASERQIADIDEPQKLATFIGNFAVQVADVAFAYHRPIRQEFSKTPIPNFLNANVLDMPAISEFRLDNKPHSNVLRVGAGHTGTIVDVARYDPLPRQHRISSSIHVAAGPMPPESSEDAIEHWSVTEDLWTAVYPFHPLFQKPEYWQSHATVLRDLTRLVIVQVPKVS
ncbi:MAG TPA: hypothetical protein VLG16_05325 [Candidatus Saccharimonadales bacterium]|nr:hypothetical protein [Candidatus Saccharimonadales bacterium]